MLHCNLPSGFRTTVLTSSRELENNLLIIEQCEIVGFTSNVQGKYFKKMLKKIFFLICLLLTPNNFVLKNLGLQIMANDKSAVCSFPVPSLREITFYYRFIKYAHQQHLPLSLFLFLILQLPYCHVIQDSIYSHLTFEL